MINVKTGNKELKFRVQGKLANYETSIPVALDHNVQSKLNDGSLVKVKRIIEKPKPGERPKSK